MLFGRILRQTIFYPIVLIVTFFVCNNPFFWDTVQLASKHGHFFYETNFQSIILPEAIDSGHPPLFGMYIALVWKIFGKTLCASHFAMLPFLIGIVYFLQANCKRLLGEKLAVWGVLLCLVDPVLAGQMVLVSPDLVLVCCFLMALTAIWEQKPWLLALGVVGLGLISTRGMMLGFALFLFSLFASEEKLTLNHFFKKLFPFLPGGLLAACFLCYHWVQTGWVGYHVSSTWAPSFEPVDFQGFVKNVGVLIWRVLDFGRVFIWLAILAVGFFMLKKTRWRLPRINRLQTGWQLFFLTTAVFLAIVPTQLFYKGLLAHRYLLPFFLSLNLTAIYMLFNGSVIVLKKANRNIALTALCIALASGNLWVYPQKTAMGWDSTLAHLPWYSLLEQSKAYLKSEKIPYESVGTAFPNIGSREIYELNGVQEGFVEKNLETNCFVFYSNVMNDFSDAEIDTLKLKWEKVFQRESGGVCAIIYKNPKKGECEN